MGGVAAGQAVRAAREGRLALREAVSGLQISAASVANGHTNHGATAAAIAPETLSQSVSQLVASAHEVCGAAGRAGLDLRDGMRGFGSETYQAAVPVVTTGMVCLVAGENYYAHLRLSVWLSAAV